MLAFLSAKNDCTIVCLFVIFPFFLIFFAGSGEMGRGREGYNGEGEGEGGGASNISEGFMFYLLCLMCIVIYLLCWAVLGWDCGNIQEVLMV